jgi:glutamyl-Q tRNA(Asp) synthetase
VSVPFVTRFAPSPTGRLHRGHAFSALTAHEAAREAGGRFLLRMEDIDATRCRPQFEAGIHEDLTWLGLDWETPVRRQSEHMADYQAALDRLAARGLIYRCFRTRRELAEEITRAPHGAPDAWRGAPLPAEEEARRLAAGEPFAWRLWMAAAQGSGLPPLSFLEEAAGPDGEHGAIPVDLAAVGDVVLARKDVGVAYHLAVVVDDALQGVTHVSAARTCSTPPRSSASSRPCSPSPPPPIATTACSPAPTASATPSATARRPLRSCGRGG